MVVSRGVIMLSLICKKKYKHKAFFFDQPFAGVEYPEGGSYLGQFLLSMRRWPLRTPTPLQCIWWPVIDPILVIFGQM